MKRNILIFLLCVVSFFAVEKAASALEILPPPELGLGQTYEVGRVKASHILVKTQEEALKIRKEIVGGKSFEQAAKEYSMCPSKDDGGDLGFFCRGMMVPEFEKAAFSLPVSKLSMPVKTEFGWHLIMVTDR